jgi:hypothetical protein
MLGQQSGPLEAALLLPVWAAALLASEVLSVETV